MIYLLRLVGVLAWWLAWIPLRLLGSTVLMSLAFAAGLVGLWASVAIGSKTGANDGAAFFLAFIVGVLVAYTLCRPLAAAFPPPGLPGRPPPRSRLRTMKQAVWHSVARPIDSPAVMTTRARLPPRLQLLMRRPSSAPTGDRR